MKALVSIVVTLVGVLVFLTTATVVRSRVRELKGHIEHCKEMCNPAAPDADSTDAGDRAACCGAAA